MGLRITELLPVQSITLDALAGKVVAIDASNHLYQFLSSIRMPTGDLFTDGSGNVTSHLIGLFSRTANLLQKNIKVAYIFDGRPPELKKYAAARRKNAKEAAAQAYEKAAVKKDTAEMRKFAARTSRLTSDMIQDAKRLLDAMGVPTIQAPSEAEAQTAAMVKQGRAYAAASQDADSFMFGAERLVRNLSLTGRRKKAGTLGSTAVDIQLVELRQLLQKLGISQNQLIALAMLIGTDYAPDGIRGIGPVKALKLVKEHGDGMEKLFAAVRWNEHYDYSWKQVYDTIVAMPVTADYALHWKEPDENGVTGFLCGERGFSMEKVEKTVAGIMKQHRSGAQKGLDAFT